MRVQISLLFQCGAHVLKFTLELRKQLGADLDHFEINSRVHSTQNEVKTLWTLYKIWKILAPKKEMCENYEIPNGCCKMVDGLTSRWSFQSWVRPLRHSSRASSCAASFPRWKALEVGRSKGLKFQLSGFLGLGLQVSCAFFWLVSLDEKQRCRLKKIPNIRKSSGCLSHVWFTKCLPSCFLDPWPCLDIRAPGPRIRAPGPRTGGLGPTSGTAWWHGRPPFDAFGDVVGLNQLKVLRILRHRDLSK